MSDTGGMVQIRDPAQESFPLVVPEQLLWTHQIIKELKPDKGDLNSLVVIGIHSNPIIFAGSPSGCILTNFYGNSQSKAFKAHTDTDKVFGTEYNQQTKKKHMANAQLREMYKDIILLVQLTDNPQKIISFSRGGLLRHWILNEEPIPPLFAPQNYQN